MKLFDFTFIFLFYYKRINVTNKMFLYRKDLNYIINLLEKILLKHNTQMFSEK